MQQNQMFGAANTYPRSRYCSFEQWCRPAATVKGAPLSRCAFIMTNEKNLAIIRRNERISPHHV